MQEYSHGHDPGSQTRERIDRANKIQLKDLDSDELEKHQNQWQRISNEAWGSPAAQARARNVQELAESFHANHSKIDKDGDDVLSKTELVLASHELKDDVGASYMVAYLINNFNKVESLSRDLTGRYHFCAPEIQKGITKNDIDLMSFIADRDKFVRFAEASEDLARRKTIVGGLMGMGAVAAASTGFATVGVLAAGLATAAIATPIIAGAAVVGALGGLALAKFSSTKQRQHFQNYTSNAARLIRDTV